MRWHKPFPEANADLSPSHLIVACPQDEKGQHARSPERVLTFLSERLLKEAKEIVKSPVDQFEETHPIQGKTIRPWRLGTCLKRLHGALLGRGRRANPNKSN